MDVPSGTKDFSPYEAYLREDLLQKIRNVYRLYGAVPIETPIFEYKDVLIGKYGEDEKLIYELKEGARWHCGMI